jgi:CRISPR-associated protein (TIGR03984 family)
MSQPTQSASPSVAGCDLVLLDAAVSAGYLAWLIGEAGARSPDGATDLVWALAHCDDGVTWGRYDKEANRWVVGSIVASDVSPPIRRETLQELRLFGETCEVLIWRTSAGFRARLARETNPRVKPDNESDPLSPADESRILRGDRVRTPCEHGFTRLADGTGAEQVIPLAVTEEQLGSMRVRLDVRHYYEKDAKTGAVRIALTRLVRITGGGGDGA